MYIFLKLFILYVRWQQWYNRVGFGFLFALLCKWKFRSNSVKGQPICQGGGGAAFSSFVCLCNLNFHYPFPSGLYLTTLLLYVFRKKNICSFSVDIFLFSGWIQNSAVRRWKCCAVKCYLMVVIPIWERNSMFTFLLADVGIKPQCSGLKTNPWAVGKEGYFIF